MRWPAVLAAVLASLAFIGLPSVVAGQPAANDVPQWHPLSVPWPNVGDAGSYTRSVVRLSSPGGEVLGVESPFLRESFLVEPSDDAYGADGSAHRVVSFRTWFATEAVDARFLLEAHAGTTVSTTLFERSGGGYSNRTYFGGLDRLPPLCGLRNSLQGAGDPGDALLVLQSEPCRRANFVADASTGFVRVREDAWGDSGEQVAVGFQQAGTDKVVLVWFTSDIPYPVRMLEEVGDGAYALLDLTHFQRGTVAAAQGKSTLPPLPALQMAPHLGIGGDDSGVEHPFPWHEAWAAARQDDQVAEFLEQHPDAVVQRAVYNSEELHRPAGDVPMEREDVIADAWYFHLDDGQQAQKFVVRHSVGQRSMKVPVVGPVETEPIDAIEVEDMGGQSADPYALAAPPSIPTVSSTLAWWNAVATKRFRDEGPNGWMTFLSCGCGQPWAAVAVGRLAKTTTTDEATTVQWEASFLHTTWEGKAYALLENVVESDYGRASGPVPRLERSIPTPLKEILRQARDHLPVLKQMPDHSPGPLLETQGQPGTGAAAARPSVLSAEPVTPPNAQAVSPALVVGVAAAGAIGLAGVAWLARFLALALFSRVRRESALEHPVRATLLDLIEAEPGLHLQELVRRTGKGAGTVRHHLAKLEDVGLVKSRQGGGFLCYFPSQAGAAAMAAAGVTKSDGARRVLEAARAGGTSADLARRTGLAPGTVDHHLERLSAAGVVRREGMRWTA